MSRLLLLAAAFTLVPHARADSLVKCEDGTKAVSLNLTFNKKESTELPKKVVIISSGKSKEIERKEIIRFIRNASDFYMLFKVQTKVGPHDSRAQHAIHQEPTSAKILSRNSSQQDSGRALECDLHLLGR